MNDLRYRRESAALHAAVHCDHMTRHFALRQTMKECKGQTLCRWLLAAESNENHLTLSSCIRLDGNDLNGLDIKLKQICAKNWNAAPFTQRNNDTRVF